MTDDDCYDDGHATDRGDRPGDVGAAGGVAPADCPLCGAAFACGATAGRCWCFDRPAVGPVPGAPPGRCVCPECLPTSLRKPGK